ncbi:hypothetical protein [Kitasatospora sp. McL0602]|uniref:hypothetical protein n=1 Tax=Kitasatospora sp. McL0602 TaxID=3439530 RepID=UPI003F8C4F09
MTVRPAWLLNPGQTRADTRAAPLGTMTPADAMTTKAGVIPGGAPLLLTGTGMTGTLSTGRATVQGSTGQGAYPVAVTSPEPFTVANGHASLARIDSVFLTVYDQLYDTSGQTAAAIAYVQGTAASSPTAPTTVPGSTAYLRLWDIAVPAGASAGAPINWASALTDRRTYTTSLGGIGYGSDTTPGAYPGQYRDTGAGLQRWSGSAWEDRILLGADTELYRSAPNTLTIPDRLNLGAVLWITTSDVNQNVLVGDAPAGQNSRLAVLRVGGSDRFSLSADGSLTLAGGLTVAGVGGVQNIYKWSTQTQTTNTSMVNDVDLYFNVQPNAKYIFDGHLSYSGETFAIGPADLRADWTIPSGADFAWQRGGYPSNTTAQVDTVQTDHATVRVLGTFGSGTIVTARFSGRVATSGSGGVCQFRWAQNNPSATTTSMRVGSWIRVTRVQ